MPQTESKDVRPSDARIDTPQENPNRIREAELGAAMQFLAFALRMASTYDPAQRDHGRGSVRTALVGVIKLIAELFPNEPALPISLNHLLYGLWDLDRGKVVPLLKPIEVSNNPGNSLSEDLFRALPAAAMTRLMDHRMVKRADAARDVARRLTKEGYRHPSGEPITGPQVEDWRDKMMTERAAENRAVAQYQLAIETVKAMEAREAFEFLMRSMPSLYPPNFRKNPPSYLERC
jgi:hypothetical protein